MSVSTRRSHPPNARNCAEEDSGKRKREEGDDMAALEAAVAGTRLQGFVSGGTVQPDQRTQDEAAAAAGLGARCPIGPCMLSFASCQLPDDITGALCGVKPNQTSPGRSALTPTCSVHFAGLDCQP